MHTALRSWSWASERKKESIGKLALRGCDNSSNCSAPCRMVRLLFGGITYTWSRSTDIPSSTWQTGIFVRFCNNSGMMLMWVGSRCTMTTKAIPESAGIAAKNNSKASSPPAEAPIPTIGKPGATSVATMDFASGLTVADGGLAKPITFLAEAGFLDVLLAALFLTAALFDFPAPFPDVAVSFTLRDVLFLSAIVVSLKNRSVEAAFRAYE